MTTEQERQQEMHRQMQAEMLRRQQAQQELNAQIIQAQRWAQESQQAIDNAPRWKYGVLAAVDLDRGFAKSGKIPWNYPDDLVWFKQLTTNQICVMGRKTYEDINQRLGDKSTMSVLPDRKCFVVSSALKQADVHNATVIAQCTDVTNYLDSSDIEKTIFFIVFKE